jgi:hypothetical protein
MVRCNQVQLYSTFSPATTPVDGRCLGGNWISEKKDKSGKGKATHQDRPVPHVEAKNSTLRHCGDEL